MITAGGGQKASCLRRLSQSPRQERPTAMVSSKSFQTLSWPLAKDSHQGAAGSSSTSSSSHSAKTSSSGFYLLTSLMSFNVSRDLYN